MGSRSDIIWVPSAHCWKTSMFFVRLNSFSNLVHDIQWIGHSSAVDLKAKQEPRIYFSETAVFAVRFEEFMPGTYHFYLIIVFVNLVKLINMIFAADLIQPKMLRGPRLIYKDLTTDGIQLRTIYNVQLAYIDPAWHEQLKRILENEKIASAFYRHKGTEVNSTGIHSFCFSCCAVYGVYSLILFIAFIRLFICRLNRSGRIYGTYATIANIATKSGDVFAARCTWCARYDSTILAGCGLRQPRSSQHVLMRKLMRNQQPWLKLLNDFMILLCQMTIKWTSFQ